MRSVTSYKLGLESFESMCEARRENRAVTLTFKYKRNPYTYIIGAGTTDNVYVYNDNNLFYVLIINYNLGYCGLEIYDPTHGQINDIFLQGNEIEQVGGLDLAPITIVKRLAQFMG